MKMKRKAKYSKRLMLLKLLTLKIPGLKIPLGVPIFMSAKLCVSNFTHQDLKLFIQFIHKL